MKEKEGETGKAKDSENQSINKIEEKLARLLLLESNLKA